MSWILLDDLSHSQEVLIVSSDSCQEDSRCQVEIKTSITLNFVVCQLLLLPNPTPSIANQSACHLWAANLSGLIPVYLLWQWLLCQVPVAVVWTQCQAPRDEQELQFPGFSASDSRSQKLGINFSFSFPKFGNEIFMFPKVIVQFSIHDLFSGTGMEYQRWVYEGSIDKHFSKYKSHSRSPC